MRNEQAEEYGWCEASEGGDTHDNVSSGTWQLTASEMASLLYISWGRVVLLSGNISFHCGSCCFLFAGRVSHRFSCLASVSTPTHASVLLSSRTQGNSCALYLMQMVWCFADIPSRCHHYTYSYSCTVCSHCPISYFNVRSIFIPWEDTFH